jgi:hypothetical protein
MLSRRLAADALAHTVVRFLRRVETEQEKPFLVTSSTRLLRHRASRVSADVAGLLSRSSWIVFGHRSCFWVSRARNGEGQGLAFLERPRSQEHGLRVQANFPPRSRPSNIRARPSVFQLNRSALSAVSLHPASPPPALAAQPLRYTTGLRSIRATFTATRWLEGWHSHEVNRTPRILSGWHCLR